MQFIATRTSLVLAGLLSLILLLSLSTTGWAANLKSRTCIDTGATTLTSLGVKCGAARHIALKAVDKSNCPPRPDFRGCYKTVVVSGWSCHGLFPGEGESFTCRNGPRRIHSSGGG